MSQFIKLLIEVLRCVIALTSLYLFALDITTEGKFWRELMEGDWFTSLARWPLDGKLRLTNPLSFSKQNLPVRV